MAIAAAALLAGCAQPPEPPAPPGFFVTYDEDPFGNTVVVREAKAVKAAARLLEPRFGHIEVRYSAVLPKGTEARARAYYSDALKKSGWGRVPLTASDLADGELAAWTRDRAVFALLIVDTADGYSQRPVLTLVNDKVAR